MSEQFLATASVRIVPDVTGFAAALQAEVAAATRSIRLAPALAASTVATKTFTAATGVSTLAVKQNAVALEQEGAAAATAAATNRLSAKAAREAAVAHSQMARGVATATASQFGLRGAVLASSGPFLAAVIAVEAVRKSIDEFTAEQEAAARATKVFGSSAKELEDNAHGMAAGFGLSAAEALKFEGAIGEVFHNVGIANDVSAKFSERLVKLSADVGAFNNADPSQVLRAFQLGLSGNLRGLRQFVPGITAARVALQAMANTGKETKASLTDQELTVARYQVILQAAQNQVGTFAERSGNLAAQSKILQSNIQNLAATFGKLASPVLLDVVKNANLAFQALGKLASVNIPGGGLLGDILGKAHDLGVFASVTGTVGLEFKLAKFAIDQFTGSEEKAGHDTTALEGVMLGLGGALDEAAAAFLHLAASANQIAFNTAIGQIDALKEHLTQLEIVGGTSAQKIATLQAEAAAAQTAVRNATTVQGRRSAREQRAQALAEIASIRAADAAAAKAAQSAAESAASKAKAAAEAAARAAQQALDAQDAALAFRQQFAQGQLAIAAATAAGTKSLTDDIANLRDQLTLTEQQVVEASKIHDAQTRLNTIQQLQLQAITLQNQIDEAIAQQRQNIRDRKVAAAEAKVTIAGLDAQLAETLGHPQDRIAALRRQNAALEEEKKLWQGNGVKLREIRNQIADNNKTIKDIQGEQQKGISAALQFQFLQTQQGFAANLLGNLIPTGSTAGLVGGPTSGAISTATSVPGPAGFATAAHGRPGHDLTTATQTSGLRGASAGQMSTLIHINSQMLAAMLRLAGRSAAPEAGRQHGWQSTPLTDTFGW